MRYQLLVFDWDGTLYNSSDYIVNCVQTAAREAGFSEPEPAVIKSMIGLSVEEALRGAMPDLSPMQIANLTTVYRECIANNQHVKPTLYEGALETLKQLHKEGYWLAIATGKSRAGLDEDLLELGIQQYFLASRCGDEATSKPHPQMLQEIMDELGMEADKTLMIGDTEYDMLLASNAGVNALAATYGMHHVTQMNQDNVVGYLDRIQDLPEWLAAQ